MPGSSAARVRSSLVGLALVLTVTTVGSAEPLRVVAPGEEIEIEAEEAEPVKCLHTPILPSQSDVDEHRISHIPYWNWCPRCLAAMGRENPHVSVDHAKRAIPTIAMDYMFLTTKGVKFKNETGELGEDEQKGALKVLIVRDLRSKSLLAHAVEKKGLALNVGYGVESLLDSHCLLG